MNEVFFTYMYHLNLHYDLSTLLTVLTLKNKRFETQILQFSVKTLKLHSSVILCGKQFYLHSGEEGWLTQVVSKTLVLKIAT